MTARLRWRARWVVLWNTGRPQGSDVSLRTWLVFQLFRGYRRLVGRPIRPFVTQPGDAWRVTDQMRSLSIQIGRVRLFKVCDGVTISREPIDRRDFPSL